MFATADGVLIWRLHSTTGVKRSSGRNNNMGDDFGFVQARRSVYFKNVCRGARPIVAAGTQKDKVLFGRGEGLSSLSHNIPKGLSCVIMTPTTKVSQSLLK